MAEFESQKKHWPMWILLLFMLGCTYLFDYIHEAYTSWKLSNRPRPEHAKHISQAKALAAGPLDVSFFPEISQYLYFGDSLETILAKMGREPDKKYNISNNSLACAFFLSPGMKQPHNGYKINSSVIIYIFRNNHLHSTLFAQFFSYSESSGFDAAAADFGKLFLNLYGSSSIFTQEKLFPTTTDLKAMLWELNSNATLLLPLEHDEQEKSGTAFILLCPLNASGHYDFRTYIPSNDMMRILAELRAKL